MVKKIELSNNEINKITLIATIISIIINIILLILTVSRVRLTVINTLSYNIKIQGERSKKMLKILYTVNILVLILLLILNYIKYKMI